MHYNILSQQEFEELMDGFHQSQREVSDRATSEHDDGNGSEVAQAAMRGYIGDITPFLKSVLGQEMRMIGTLWSEVDLLKHLASDGETFHSFLFSRNDGDGVMGLRFPQRTAQILVDSWFGSSATDYPLRFDLSTLEYTILGKIAHIMMSRLAQKSGWDSEKWQMKRLDSQLDTPMLGIYFGSAEICWGYFVEIELAKQRLPLVIMVQKNVLRITNKEHPANSLVDL